MGRPTKSTDEKRTETARFRVTVSERADLEAKANAAGLDLSEYCRRRALGYRLPAVRTGADERLLLEVNRIGVNLNQIAKAANLGRSLDGMLTATLIDVQRIMATISEELDGGRADGS